ncbi:hypothetical protein D3C81_1606000 [compost metagenome]
MVQFAQHAGLAQAVGDITVEPGQGRGRDLVLVLGIRAHGSDVQPRLQVMRLDQRLAAGGAGDGDIDRLHGLVDTVAGLYLQLPITPQVIT